MEAKLARHTLHPGQIVDRSGIYHDPKSGERTTLVSGKRVPPTPFPNGKWVEDDDSHPDKPSRPKRR
jgi:hypothetical protein